MRIGDKVRLLHNNFDMQVVEVDPVGERVRCLWQITPTNTCHGWFPVAKLYRVVAEGISSEP